MHSSSAVVRLGAGLVLGFGLLAGVVPEAGAEIRAGGRKGLFTKVNGKTDGSCRAGICKISGGTSAGKNLFHRFRRFDTRGKIKGVEFDAIGKKNLIVGVTSAKGSFIDKSIGLNSSANLFWLSPGGIHLGKGASFVNVPNLTLSTANTLRFGNGSFDVFRSQASDLTGLTGQPLPGSLGLVVDSESDAAGGIGRAGIHLDGIDVSIDESLYIDAIDDAVTVRSSSVSVDSSDKVGGSLTLTGQSVDVDGATRLSATGAKGGGVIQVGGSWQNGDASVRQATTTTVGSEVVIDASATEQGDGGEIVVWSDITNVDSLTDVSGSLLAAGGISGGDGGRIETSGARLLLSSGLDVRANAPLKGSSGLWLQDPYDYVIGTGARDNIVTALNNDTSVTISTALNNAGFGSQGADDGLGNIEIQASVPIAKTSGNDSVALTLQADNDIIINSDITSSSGQLDVIARAKGAILVTNSANISSNGGDIVLWSNADNVSAGAGDHSVRVDGGTSLTSGGGKIVLAGGLDSNADGYPDGFAYIGSYVSGTSPGLTLGDPTNPLGPVITLNSGGGDIVMRGRSGLADIGSDGFGSQRALLIDSGEGTIEIVGDQNSSGGGVGLRFGSINNYPEVAISSASTESPAIRIVGSSVNKAGIWLGEGNANAELAGTVLIQSSANTGGGISIEGAAAQAADNFDHRAIALWGDESGNSIPNVYQFLSNSGPIEFLSTVNSVSSQIGIWSDTYLGQRKDAATVQGVTPISGSADVVARFKADNWVSFMDSVYGSGSIEISPYTGGQSVGVQSQDEFWVENLNNLAPTFSLVTVGDSVNTNGMTSTAAITLTTPTIFDAGSGGLSFTQPLTSSDKNLTLNVAGASSVVALNLGTGSLTKSGAGSLDLTSDNTYSGSTVIGMGTLKVSSSGALGSSTSLNIDGGTLQISADVPGATGTVALGNDGGVVNVDAGQTFVYNGIVSGSGQFSKQGAGILELSGNNTHTGPTQISAGTLRVTGYLADSTPVTVDAGATYEIGTNDTIGSLSGAGTVLLPADYQLQPGADNTDTTFSGVISGTGQFFKHGTGELTLSGANEFTGFATVDEGTLNVTGSLADSVQVSMGNGTYRVSSSDTIGSFFGTTGEIVLANGAVLTTGDNTNNNFSGSMSGAGGLVKGGTGQLSLSGATTYTGVTNINAGTLTVGALSDSGDVTVAAGAVYELTADDTIGSLAGGGSVQLSNYQLQTGGNNASTAFSGVISGTGGLTKLGTGQLTLSGENTYTGATTVQAGTLSIESPSNISGLSSSTALTVDVGGIFKAQTGGTTNVGSLAGAGTVEIVSANDVLEVGVDNSSTIFSGQITGAGGLAKVGTGSLNLTNTANDFGSGRGNQQPVVLVSGGSLTVDSDGALGSAVGDSSILIENNAVLGFKGSTTLDSERGIEFGTAGGKIEVDPGFTVVVPSNLSGTTEFEKLGDGTLQLTAANPGFTATTTVSGGTLFVSGANPATATCTNSGSSNLCSTGYGGQSPTPTDTDDTDDTNDGSDESGDTTLTPTPTPGDTDPTPTPGDEEPTPTPGDTDPTPTPGDEEPTPTPGDTDPTPTPGDEEPTPTPGDDQPTPSPDDTNSTPEPTPAPDSEEEASNETTATLAESGVDEDTAVAVVQRVDDPSITTVSTPGAEAAATPSPAASSGTGSGSSTDADVATASGSSSSIPSSLSADGVAVELTMESSFSMTSSGDDAPSSVVPAAATAGDGGGETSAATATESATTESSSDSSTETGDEGGADAQETQADGDDGADDGEADGSADSDDGSDTTTAESDQPQSPAVAVTRVSAEQASRNLQSGDAVSTQRAVQGLNLPELSGRSTPSVQSISGFLQQLRQQVANP